MKRNILLTLAAVVVCGLAVTLFTQCKKENKNPEVKMMYYVSVSPDVLNVADVEINYLDATGAKQKEILTDTTWRKPLTTNTLPLTEGAWAKLTPKASIADGNYQLRIHTVAAYDIKLTDGTNTHDGWQNANYSTITTAQNADEVSAWCAQSPTVAITIDKEGVSDLTHVDFGGNSEYGDNDNTWCRFLAWLFGFNEDEYCSNRDTSK
ncbi:MAG: hypothetical protein IKM95_01555 [Bacteroidales bacterium]|nr:hypothetical protein [Bacteroidales bacterium]